MSKAPAPVLGALLLALAPWFPATAQDGPAAGPVVDRLEVSLWSEYDQPAMLVMLHGELSAGTPLPAELALPVPAQVTSPHAVAWAGPDGELKVAQHVVEAREGWNAVRTTLPTRTFHLEYYADLDREPEDPLRLHTWRWPGGLAVDSLTYEVRVPADARDVVVTPQPSASGVGPDGLTYLRGELGAVAADGSARIRVAYRRDSDSLAASPPPGATSPTGPQATARTPAGPAGRAPRPETPLWPIYVAVALLVGVFIGIGIQRLAG